MRTIVIAAVVVLTASSAHATPGQCQRTIIREAALYNRKVVKLRRGCENANVGRPVPSDCSENGDLMFKILGLQSRLRLHVEKECRNETLASIGWDVGTCPDFESAGCNSPIANVDDVSDCLFCVNRVAVDQALGLYYGALTPAPNPSLRACQKMIGSSAGPFFEKKTQALARCELRDLSGDIAGPCPGDPKTDETIAALASRMTRSICSKCGGGACGGGNDRLPSEIGFSTSCPNVTLPGGASCGDDMIESLSELVACVNCVTEFKVDCLDALAAPTVKAYPPECH